MKKIQLIIEHKNHTEVVLTNKNGKTFTYNPSIHQGLEDFLSGCVVVFEKNKTDSGECKSINNIKII